MLSYTLKAIGLTVHFGYLGTLYRHLWPLRFVVTLWDRTGTISWSLVVCVQTFIIWGTEIEVVVYPSMLKSIIRQASVGPPIAVLDTLLLTFDQILKLCLQMNKEISEKRKYLTLWPVTWKRGETLGWLIKGKIHREQTPFWQKLAARQFWPCFDRSNLVEGDPLAKKRGVRKKTRPRFSKYRFPNQSAYSHRCWLNADCLWKRYFENCGCAFFVTPRLRFYLRNFGCP